MNNLVTYRTFLNKEEASELIDALTKNNIPNALEDNKASYDPTFVNMDENDRYFLKIAKEHFLTADKIQLELANKIIDSIGPDHYLYEFTDDELFEVVNKKDEWSKIDYLLAQKILKERGNELSQDTLAKIEMKRSNELAKTGPLPLTLLIIGYIFACLGGLFGILIGWHLATYKKSLPNGERVFGYSPNVRDHGTIIMIIGGSILLLAILVQLF
jgi:hypothetical protein